MPFPIISIETMREWEARSWRAGKSETDVIDRVGQRLADRVTDLTSPGARVVFLCGAGNNGADGRAAVLKIQGRRITTLTVGKSSQWIGDVQAILKKDPDWVVDALFGIGLNRPLDSEWLEILKMVASWGGPVLSVDCPSGLNVGTGAPAPLAIEAAETMTVGAVKWGLLTREAAPFVGRLSLAADVGLIPLDAVAAPSSGAKAEWIEASDFRRFPPGRPGDAHKGSFGRLKILAGAEGYSGAAVIASRAALRARPGLISVQTTERAASLIAPAAPQAMVAASPQEASYEDKTTGFLIGPGLAGNDPGLGDLKSRGLELWNEAPQAVVADASALEWLPRSARPAPGLRVVTPHPGEAARMLGQSVKEIESDRFAAVEALSERLGGAYVVLKGARTLVGRAGAAIGVNSSGNAGLAQGGAGDALAGFLAGLLAQPSLAESPEKAIRYAVWFHGVSADRLAHRGLNWDILDLIAEMKQGSK